MKENKTSETLRTLLHRYGLLYISLSTLVKERPGSEHNSYDEYQRSLGDIEENEPLVVVRISENSESRILHPGDHDFAILDTEAGKVTDNISIMELPEDEFYFFGAFRYGLFDLDRELPAFFFNMSLMQAYALFEAYISDVIRDCLLKHPKLLGSDKHVTYAEIIDSKSRDELLYKLVDKTVNENLYLPIIGVLDLMRKRYGFKNLSNQYDINLMEISLIRNCVTHNKGKADHRLASGFPKKYNIDDQIEISLETVSAAINSLRKLAYAIDIQWQKN